MNGLEKARQNLPNLASLDDGQLVDVLHRTFYPSMDKAELASRLGYKAPAPEGEKSAGVLRTAGDVAVKLAQGTVDLGSAVVGVASLATGGHAGKFMREQLGYDPEATNQALGEYLSDSQKASDAKVSQAEGFVDTVGAAIENPRAILGSIAQSTPGMVGGMGVARAAATRIAAKAALATPEGIAAARGLTGARAAQAALKTQAGQQAAKAAVEKAGTTLIGVGAATEGAQTAGSIADRAQAAGREYGDYALPSVGAGVGTALIGLGAGKLMGDAATEIATGSAAAGGKGGFLARTGKQAFSEGVLEEMPQSAQEQVFTNAAMGEQDLSKGVGNAAGVGLVTGAAMGGGMGALQKSAAQPVVLPNTGPLSQAANAGQAAAAAIGAPPAAPVPAVPGADPAQAAPAAPAAAAPVRSLGEIDARLSELHAIGRGTPDKKIRDTNGALTVIPGAVPRPYTPEEKAEYSALMAERKQRVAIPADQQEEFNRLLAEEDAARAATKSQQMQQGAAQPAPAAPPREAPPPADLFAKAWEEGEAAPAPADQEAEINRLIAEEEAQAEQADRALMDETNARIERDMLGRAAANRAALRDRILNDASIPADHKKRAFQKAMEADGYTFPVVSDEDGQAIDAHIVGLRARALDHVLNDDSIPAARKAGEAERVMNAYGIKHARLTEAEQDVIAEAIAPEPAAPNELIDAVRERAVAPAPAPTGANTAAVDAAIAAGMRLKTSTGSVLHKKGSSKVFRLSAAQKAYYLERMAAEGDQQPAAPAPAPADVAPAAAEPQSEPQNIPENIPAAAPADGWELAVGETYTGGSEAAAQAATDRGDGYEYRVAGDGVTLERRPASLPTVERQVKEFIDGKREAPPEPSPPAPTNAREAAYDAAVDRHNAAVRRYKAAEASGDQAGMATARAEAQDERGKMQQAALGGVKAAIAQGQAERLPAEIARLAAMPLGTQARPSEFAPATGIHFEKTSTDEWTARGDWALAGQTRSNEDLAKRGGMIFTEPSPEKQALDAAAHEAATSPQNDRPEPTDAQKEAGNYKKGHVRLHGLEISIENPTGSVRRGVAPDGTPWETTMQNHYGDILGTKGADGDAVDVFIGPNLESAAVFVVDQIDPASGKFDEHKVLMGFDTVDQARAAYSSNYDADWKGGDRIITTDVAGLKGWLDSGKTSEPIAYAGVGEAADFRPRASEADLDTELQDALGHLGDVLGDMFAAKLNATGQQHTAADLLPALSKVIELLVRKGFRSFAASTGAAAKAMRANEKTAPHVDRISARQWKAAYNAIAEYHEGTDAEDAIAAISAEDVLRNVAAPAPAAPKAEPAPAAAAEPAPESPNAAAEALAAEVAVNLAKMARREHPATRDARTDRIAVAENYVEQLTEADPALASAAATELRANREKYSEMSGMPPDSIGKYAGVIEKRLDLIEQRKATMARLITDAEDRIAEFKRLQAQAGSNAWVYDSKIAEVEKALAQYRTAAARMAGAQVDESAEQKEPKVDEPAAEKESPAPTVEAPPVLTKIDLNKMTVKDMTDEQLLQAQDVLADTPRAPKIAKEIERRGLDKSRDPAPAPTTQPEEAPADDGALERQLLDSDRAERAAAAPAQSEETDDDDGAAAASTAPEHARMDGTGPKTQQFTSPEFKAAADEIRAVNAAWDQMVDVDFPQWFTKAGKKKDRKLKIDAPREAHIALAEWTKRSKAASDAYNAALTAEKLGVATGEPVTEVVPVEGDKLLMTMDKEAFATVTNEWASLFAEPGDEFVSMDKRTAEELTPEQAAARIEEWKEHARRQGEEHGGENFQRTVLSLFDLTGEWSKPWEEAGYNVLRFDIQSGQDVFDFSVEYFTENYDLTDVYCILAATPCTDFASSGAKHFLKKDEDGRTEQSVELVNQTARTIEYFRPAVWALENPVGRLTNLTGLPEPRLSFQPHHFGDPYTKRTMIWGQFNGELPSANVFPSLGSKMHSQYGGSSIETKNARSETPEGFAYAFFMANNYIDMPVERRLTSEYPEVSGAILEALREGVTVEQIHELMDDTYGNYEYDEARDALIAAVAERHKAPDWKPSRLTQAQWDAIAAEKGEAYAQGYNAKLQGYSIQPPSNIRSKKNKQLFEDGHLAAGRDLESDQPGKALAELTAPAQVDAPAASNEDDGSDIPLAFFKKVKVPHDVWVVDKGAYVTREIPADKAIASVREDIENLTALLKCMGGS